MRAEGGWDAVDTVFTDPPQATSLILHPERYLAGERTVPAAEVPLKPGETLASQTKRGEYAVRLLLARQPETRSLIGSIGDSYETDALGVITRPSGARLHRWVIELSSSDSTEVLAAGITAALTAELKDKPVVRVENDSLIAEWSSAPMQD